MNDEPAKSEQVAVEAAHARHSHHMHWSARVVLALCALLLMLLLAGMALLRYVQGPGFHERVRRHVIERLELATGGIVELQRVSWILDRLEFELDGLTIHGNEPLGAPPLLQVEKVRGRLSWSDVLPGRLWLRELELLHPQAHVEIGKDGSTNLPEPKMSRMEEGTPPLRMAIARAELRDGALDWNDTRIKLNGRADELFVDLRYRSAGGRAGRGYEGDAKVGRVQMQLPGYEPVVLSAAAHFMLHRDRLEVPRIEVRAEKTWVQAAGEVSNLVSSVAQFSYSAQGDLAELARIERYPALRGGKLEISGSGRYLGTSGELALAGNARASAVSWENHTLRLEKLNGGFDFALDHNELNASAIFISGLGGTFHGQMKVSRAQGKPQQGRLALETNDVELAQVLRAFTRNDLPLDRLPLAGAVFGPLSANWQGDPEDATVEGDLRVQARQRPGDLPVSAVVQATVSLRDDSVQIHSMEASTPATQISAHGRISSDSDLKLQVSSLRSAELEPIANAWRGSRAETLPIELGGAAHWVGSVRGRLLHPSLQGHLELHDFVSVVRMQGSAAAKGERVLRTHWDQLEGDVEYSSVRENLRNAVLRRGSARIGVDASVPLLDGSYDYNQPFSAHVKAQNVPAAEIEGMFGAELPVSGAVSGEVQVSGTSSHLAGSGNVAVRDGSAWGQVVRSASAQIAFTENQAQLRNIVVVSDLMQLTGDARVNVETSEFGFDLKGSEVKLEKLQALRDTNVRVAGTASFDLKGSGTPAAPVLNGALHLRSLSLNQRALGEMSVEAVTHGTEMVLTARSNFKDLDVKVDGTVHLRDQMPMQLSADVQSTNFDPLIESVSHIRHSGASELKMHIEASGEARHPREMKAEVRVDRWTSSFGGITVTNDGPILLGMENQVVRVQQFRMAGEGGSRFLQVRGEAQLGGKREIDLHAGGNLNLKLLESVDPNLTASGVANLNLRVSGTLQRPLMHGGITVQNASVSSIDFPNGLSEITGTLVFNEDRLQVQELTARTGGGLLHCGGFIVYSPVQGLGFSLSASGHDIRLRYPEGLSSTADAGFTLTGSLKSAVLAGDVTVTRIGLNPQFDFASYLAKEKRNAPAQKIDTPLNDVRLDVHVTSTPELEVQTTLARLSGNIDLRLRGSAARPSVLGRVNLLEGTMYFNGTKYRIERGDVTFTNPIRIDPILDVELSARVRDYDITLGFHGSLDKLTPSYRSDPPLSSSDIISLLALGRTTEEQANPAMMGSAQYQPSVSESASTALIGQALNATVSSRVQRLFGVSRLKIDPNVGGATSAGLARVTVEQQVSKDLTLTYITNLNQSAQQIIQFEYNISSSVSVVGVRDQTGVVSIDFLLRRRKK